jgi:hypothetical protein
LAAIVPLLSLCVAAGPAAATICTDLYPFAVEENHVCIVAAAAETSEQETDFLAHCRNATAERYVGFERNDSTGHISCIFKPLTEDGAEGKSDLSSRFSAESQLPSLVRAWSERCLAKERDDQSDKVACWLEAAQAIDGYAADIDAALAHQINELQAAWLRRARGLLAMQTRRATFVQPVSTAVTQPAESGTERADRIPALPPSCSPGATGECNTAPASYENSLGAEPLDDGEAAQVKSIKRKPLNRAKGGNKPSKARAGLKGRSQSSQRAVERNQKLNMPRTAKRLALAEGGDPKRKVVQPATPQVRSFKTKTATTSRCFVSAEWC